MLLLQIPTNFHIGLLFHFRHADYSTLRFLHRHLPDYGRHRELARQLPAGMPLEYDAMPAMSTAMAKAFH